MYNNLIKKLIPKSKWIIQFFRIIWILIILNNEFFVFLSSAKQCLHSKSLISPLTSQFMLVADPQITDDKSYDRHQIILSITKFYSALYMKRNYKYLLNTLEPREIFFMGDLMDNGREWDRIKYKSEVDRFHSIFKSTQKKHYMVGNHDIGFEGATIELRDRFEEYFGNTSYILESDGYAFIVLDTISLSSNDPNLKNSVLSILNSELPAKPRILMSHVPLYRSADVSCGPNRQKLNTIIPNAAGYQYQNLVSKELSDYILNIVKPIAIFSGDDHDYCKLEHKYGNNELVTEITVPTFSMSQGLKSPGVMFLDLNNPSEITTELCWLPNQIHLFIQYAYLLFITIISLGIYHIWHYITTKKRGYSHLAKEEMGISIGVQNSGIVSAKKAFVSFLNSIKDIAIVGITTYIVCILIF